MKNAVILAEYNKYFYDFIDKSIKKIENVSELYHVEIWFLVRSTELSNMEPLH